MIVWNTFPRWREPPDFCVMSGSVSSVCVCVCVCDWCTGCMCVIREVHDFVEGCGYGCTCTSRVFVWRMCDE